ncbi:MAG: VRR-NUC domain-containing protein [Acidobacteriota bacterium]
MARRSRGPEEELQRAVISWLKLLRPPWIYYHVPNGGGRSRAEAGALRAQGVLAGVPDLQVVGATGRTYYVELKAERGRLSPAQDAFRVRCARLAIPWRLARSLDQVKEALETWQLLDGRGRPRCDVPLDWPRWAAVVIDQLARGRSIDHACRTAGIGRRTHYALTERSMAYDEAVEHARSVGEAIAVA